MVRWCYVRYERCKIALAELIDKHVSTPSISVSGGLRLIAHPGRTFLASVHPRALATGISSLKCDAEPSLPALLEKCGIAVIEKSALQSPETTGGAERSVRFLKESIACLKRDYLECGLSLNLNSHSRRSHHSLRSRHLWFR